MQQPSADTRRQLNRLLPILIAAAGGYILVQEVPAVNRWYQQLTAPERQAATEEWLHPPFPFLKMAASPFQNICHLFGGQPGQAGA